MLRFVVPLIVLTTTQALAPYSQRYHSAATPAQIRFAQENKYDGTGPGAKGREYAYNTFKTLDEALVGYIDDPDTKLPDYERAKAIHLLYNKNSDQYYRFKPNPASNLVTNSLYDSPASHRAFDEQFHSGPKSLSPFRWQKVQSVKASPVNLAHYTRGPDVDFKPQYDFFYGVNDKKPGDSKSAQESRQDGVVHGYYSFTDAAGRQQTVQYSDDRRGFRTTVRREFPH